MVAPGPAEENDLQSGELSQLVTSANIQNSAVIGVVQSKGVVRGSGGQRVSELGAKANIEQLHSDDDQDTREYRRSNLVGVLQRVDVFAPVEDDKLA